MPTFPLVRNRPQFATKPDIALVMGRAPWWVPVLTKNKRQKPTFAEALKDFLANFSFHCYWKLVEPGRRCQERFFWLLFHIFALTILIIFLWGTRKNDGQMLSTTILNPLYPIHKVAVPAISICTLNRISNVSATQYAEELNARDPRKRGVKYFYERMFMMSYNYYIQDDFVDYQRALEFQRFLDLHDTEDSEMFYNTRRRMQMLTPSCSDTLVQCRLGGKEINCSQEFVETLTTRGFCCTFNHDGRYSEERDMKTSFFGQDNGLILLLNASINDNFYKTSTLDGFMLWNFTTAIARIAYRSKRIVPAGIGLVNTDLDAYAYIYTYRDYADVASSAVRERYAQTGVDSSVAITPKILQTVEESRFLRPKTRNCLFEDEMPRIFGKSYSFNKCITRCRIRSVLVLCECILFMSPLEYLDAATDTVYCTLQHKECLKRYDFKWLNVITQRQNVFGLEHEMEDALYCPDCLPSCTETRYLVSNTGMPLNPHNMRTFSKDIDSNNTDLAILRIYFAETHIPYFQQILKNAWFEIFSTFGSICGIITGFSLIGICEVAFFFAKQLYFAYKEEVSSDRKHKFESKEQLIILP